MSGILIFFHCPANTGYAIGRHEVTFAYMAKELVGSFENVHFGYPGFDGRTSGDLPSEVSNFVSFDPFSKDRTHLLEVQRYVKNNDIQLAFGFDQSVTHISHKYLREGGVRKIISYWGASMSDIFTGPLLLARKLQYRMRRHGPDHFVFQSEDMRLTATNGVGIPISKTSVVRSGVDTNRFRPGAGGAWYVHDAFAIDRARKVIYYSGHMEERKGVHVIVKAAAFLINKLGRRDLHFLFLGNKGDEAERFKSLYDGTVAENHITFGGYRNDVAEIQASSYLAVIATTGWDSHTMTAVEVAASGLPLIVSDLPGIREAISEGTGRWFHAGSETELAHNIVALADNQSMRDKLGAAARSRVLRGYTREHQINGLVDVVNKVHGTLR